ncbi:hypothetical protein [Pseudonocardia sp. NPDC049635]|uniref:hypothetical protein n=1 Tax=Pseudonocardia sp. NPDC049635 TaxID=3155506 RepID=UPI0033F6E78B
MTTPTELHRLLEHAGIDPDRLTQDCAPGAEASLLFTTTAGGKVRLTPTIRDGQHSGWAYSGWNRHGELTDTGHTTTSAGGQGVVALLQRHHDPATAPASPRQRHTLLALGDPGGHTPWPMTTASAAQRWILGLFVAWTRLRVADAGGVCGADLVDHLGQAFEAIGLTDVDLDDALDTDDSAGGDGDGDGELFDELAARVDPGPDRGDSGPGR